MIAEGKYGARFCSGYSNRWCFNTQSPIGRLLFAIHR